MTAWTYINWLGDPQDHCDHCGTVSVNRVTCHEMRCPNSWRHPKTGEPLPAPCWECGCDFTPEERPHKYSICPDCASPVDFEEDEV